MVKYSAERLDRAFGALADPTRRAILRRLRQGPATAGELAAPFAVSLPAISKHLRVLESAGLMQREKQGRIHRCRLQGEPLRLAAEWVIEYRQFWSRSWMRWGDSWKRKARRTNDD